METLITREKLLRNNPADAEKRLWCFLRRRQLSGYKFRRQAPLGHFIVDFICFEAKLIIELDGKDHLRKRRSDSHRTGCLQSMGFTILRFWNYEVFTQLNLVIDRIQKQLQSKAK